MRRGTPSQLHRKRGSSASGAYRLSCAHLAPPPAAIVAAEPRPRNRHRAQALPANSMRAATRESCRNGTDRILCTDFRSQRHRDRHPRFHFPNSVTSVGEKRPEVPSRIYAQDAIRATSVRFRCQTKIDIGRIGPTGKAPPAPQEAPPVGRAGIFRNPGQSKPVSRIRKHKFVSILA